jgi:hypothetical protein
VPTGHGVHEPELASAYCPMAQMLEVDAPVPRGHAYLPTNSARTKEGNATVRSTGGGGGGGGPSYPSPGPHPTTTSHVYGSAQSNSHAPGGAGSAAGCGLKACGGAKGSHGALRA